MHNLRIALIMLLIGICTLAAAQTPATGNVRFSADMLDKSGYGAYLRSLTEL